VIIHGRPAGILRDYRERDFAGTVLSTLDDLRRDFDVVVCEGAGSPAEVNLRDRDIANLGLARAADLPVLVVGDIDRGGVLAHLFGTLAVLDPADQDMIQAFAINKFRGDRTLLQPGLDWLTERTGRPVLGVLPWREDLWLDTEDSLSYTADGAIGRNRPPVGDQWLRVAVVRLPRVSNATDAEPLAAEPGVRVRLTVEPAELADADLVVLPGTKSTVDDLAWLRATGLADAVVAHARAGRPLLGICGGYQMLAARIHDEVESRRGTVDGLGLLPVEIAFERAKTLARPSGVALGAPVQGYEIHHGVVRWRDGGLDPLIRLPDGTGEGVRAGHLFGTHWHGAFESDMFRRAFLTEVAALAGRRGFRAAHDTSFGSLREATLDLLGDLVEEHLDTRALWRLIEEGARPGLRVVGPP
jgi:adenosylcobyric acid synthase